MSKNLIKGKLSGDATENGKLASKINFLLICLIPVFTIVAFGGVDFWQSGLLSIIFLVIFQLWLIESWKKNEFQFSYSILQIPLVGLILIGLIQLLPLKNSGELSQIIPVSSYIALSSDPFATRFAVIQLTMYFLFFSAALIYINSRKRVKIIIYVLIITVSLMSFIGILQRIAGFEFIYGLRIVDQAIFFASFINQHHFGSLMLMTIGVTLSLILDISVKKNEKIFLLFGLILMTMSLLFTGSRGALLSLIAVIGVVVSYKIFSKNKLKTDLPENIDSDKKKLIPIYIVSGVLLIVFIAGSLILLGGDDSLTRGIGLSEVESDFSHGRFHFWGVALSNFFNHPIIGSGLDSFSVIYPQYDTWNGTFRVEQAHNDYIQILSDAGILGFLCVGSFIFLFVKKATGNIKNETSRFYRSLSIGAFAGCVGILVHSFVDFPLRTPANSFVFFVMVVLCTKKYGDSK